jgi:hypothetical protein
VWLLHETRRPHDLILVTGFALLNAGGKDMFGGHISDRDSGTSDLATKNHRSMTYDTD